MSDTRIANFAKILVEHSARIVPGDRVLIEATTAAEPLIRELYIQILEKGGIPHPMVALPGMMPFSQDELYLTYAKDTMPGGLHPKRILSSCCVRLQGWRRSSRMSIF